MSAPHGGRVLVTAVGLTTVDLVQRIAEFPAPGEKLQAGCAELAAGGPAANAAVTVAALGGAGSVTLVSVLGGHPLAALARGDLTRHGVDVHDLAPLRSEPPAVSAVMVRERDGERTVVSANAAGVELDRERLDELAPIVRGASVLLLDGHHPAAALAAARAARASGIPVVLDAGSWKPQLAELLPLVDVCACSEGFTSPREPSSYGVPVVIRTHGADPVSYSAAGCSGTVSVPRVAAVDTAGAGDVWHGAFAHALAGLGAMPGHGELPELIAAANAVAARRVQHAGPRRWLAP